MDNKRFPSLCLTLPFFPILEKGSEGGDYGFKVRCRTYRHSYVFFVFFFISFSFSLWWWWWLLLLGHYVMFRLVSVKRVTLLLGVEK